LFVFTLNQVHAGDNCGVTSLMASSLLGDLETAQLMLEHAKERKRELILARGSTGWSAAHGAAQSGCIAMVKCLFDACEESISLLNPNGIQQKKKK
jgi:ankyrin repeat protein